MTIPAHLMEKENWAWVEASMTTSKISENCASVDEKIFELDGDTNKIKRKKMKVLSIYGGDFCPDDYKKKR